MKEIYYFLSSNKFEIITAVIAVLLIIASKSIVISILIVFISLLTILFLRTKDKPFFFISLKRRKQKDDWIGSGIFDYNRAEKCFEITQAGDGYIYSNCLVWSDYEIQYDFKILKSCLGLIVRAVNLANYAMLQINLTGVRPHVKINGGWIVWEAQQADLEYPNQSLSLDKWYSCKVRCLRGAINICIYSEKGEVINREWKLPQGTLLIPFNHRENDPKPVEIPFPVNLEYGSIGFRDSGHEKALVKNIVIRKI